MDFIQCCLKYDPKERTTIKDLKNHSFLKLQDEQFDISRQSSPDHKRGLASKSNFSVEGKSGNGDTFLSRFGSKKLSLNPKSFKSDVDSLPTKMGKIKVIDNENENEDKNDFSKGFEVTSPVRLRVPCLQEVNVDLDGNVKNKPEGSSFFGSEPLSLKEANNNQAITSQTGKYKNQNFDAHGLQLFQSSWNILEPNPVEPEELEKVEAIDFFEVRREDVGSEDGSSFHDLLQETINAAAHQLRSVSSSNSEFDENKLKALEEQQRLLMEEMLMEADEEEEEQKDNSLFEREQQSFSQEDLAQDSFKPEDRMLDLPAISQQEITSNRVLETKITENYQEYQETSYGVLQGQRVQTTQADPENTSIERQRVKTEENATTATEMLRSKGKKEKETERKISFVDDDQNHSQRIEKASNIENKESHVFSESSCLRKDIQSKEEFPGKTPLRVISSAGFHRTSLKFKNSCENLLKANSSVKEGSSKGHLTDSRNLGKNGTIPSSKDGSKISMKKRHPKKISLKVDIQKKSTSPLRASVFSKEDNLASIPKSSRFQRKMTLPGEETPKKLPKAKKKIPLTLKSAKETGNRDKTTKRFVFKGLPSNLKITNHDSSSSSDSSPEDIRK